MLIIKIPKHLSLGVIQSQLLNIANEIGKSKPVTLLAPEGFVFNGEESNFEIVNPGFKQLFYLLKNCETIYCRHQLDFMKFWMKKFIFRFRYKIYFDFRGLGFEESYLRNKNKRNREILYLLDKFIYKRADYLGAVSNNLSAYLQSEFGKRNIQINPCVVNDSVLKTIERKPLNERVIKFVYVGGLSKWQKFENITLIYKSIEKEMNSTLTVYTKDKLAAQAILKDHKIDHYTIKTVSQRELQSQLSEYDFGFLIRDNILLNNVASPVKFLEYTSRGVIPIISEGIGDYSALVNNYNLGILLKDNSKIDITKIEAFMNDNDVFERLHEFSQKYTWEKVLKNHIMLEHK